jgi:signal transduction histidine kinase
MSMEPDQAESPPLVDSIAGRLLRIIFACYFIVTVLVTATQLSAEYQHTKDRLLREIAAMQQTFGPGIADAMWRYNDDILRGILSGMRELPVVVGIKVADEQGKVVRAVGTVLDAKGATMTAAADGQLQPAQDEGGLFHAMFSREFPIVYTDENGIRKTIGSWTVYSNQRIVVKQVEYGFTLILVNSVIKTLALWFIFLFVVQRWLGKPLRQLTGFVGGLHIDNLGDQVFVLKDSGRHELHLLAAKLNEVVAKLKGAVADKRALNESLELRVIERTEDLNRDRQQLAVANTELAKALETLNLAHEELARTEKLAALGSMVAGIAHELNTPIGNSLTVASTLADTVQNFSLCLERGLKRSEVERFMSEMAMAVDLLNRNIERSADLVTSFKQVAVDQTSSQRRQFDLAAVIAENISALSPMLRKTPFAVLQQVPPGIVMDSFPGPLGQVLMNLVSNAVLHGFEGKADGSITIAAQQAVPGWLELCVEDDGVGIAPEYVNRIYDPFFTTKMGAGGSGLGLNITHNIVTSILGGKIHADSVLGEGTRFTVLLPLVAPSRQDGGRQQA